VTAKWRGAPAPLSCRAAATAAEHGAHCQSRCLSNSQSKHMADTRQFKTLGTSCADNLPRTLNPWPYHKVKVKPRGQGPRGADMYSCWLCCAALCRGGVGRGAVGWGTDIRAEAWGAGLYLCDEVGINCHDLGQQLRVPQPDRGVIGGQREGWGECSDSECPTNMSPEVQGQH